MNPPLSSRFQTWFKIDSGLRLINDQVKKKSYGRVVDRVRVASWRRMHAHTSGPNIETMEHYTCADYIIVAGCSQHVGREILRLSIRSREHGLAASSFRSSRSSNPKPEPTGSNVCRVVRLPALLSLAR